MCLAKPYPRCASHAGKELKAAQKAFKTDASPENAQLLKDAQDDFNITVTGIKKLRADGNEDEAEMCEVIRAARIAEAKQIAKAERQRKAAEARAEKQARAEEEKRYLNSTEGKARTAWQEAGIKQKNAWEALEADPENTELREAFEVARLEEDTAFDTYIVARERAASVRAKLVDPSSTHGFVVDPTPLTDRLKVVSNPEASSETLASFADDADSSVREKVAGHNNADADVLHKFADDPDDRVMHAMVQNPNVRFATLKKAMSHAAPYVRLAIVNTKAWAAETHAVARRLNTSISNQRAKAMSGGTSMKVVIALSTSDDTETVRRISFNPSLPLKVVQRLVRHPDERVRKAAATHEVWELAA